MEMQSRLIDDKFTLIFAYFQLFALQMNVSKL